MVEISRKLNFSFSIKDRAMKTCIIRVIKKGECNGGFFALIGEKRNACRGWVGNLKERYHWESLGIDGRIILQ
jgi:hypothetical protein